ncbi:MarC family protein [Hahella aquimaris]|uniref:MarC family protein n=1 Tax=Hahella sp. HNIBRBA332 TaxID=3015983 RepID=UPI00273A9B2E|nr:MarC family protein [Hahella sp. HNIBRBA332]WLQ13056.1 MarC family protein [Hahella sp. HNIBRBA332]
MDIVSALTLLIVVMDPLGNIPLFLSILERVDVKRRKKVLFRELLIALAILLVFLYCGQYLLKIFSLSKESVGIAGAIVLFIIALRMIFPAKREWLEDLPDGEPFIVPLAIPFVAGPSALATLILISTREPERMMDWSIVVLLAWSVTAVTLMSSTFLYKVLRKRGIIAIERLMGMLLIAVSVEMFLTGLQPLLTKLTHVS